MDSNGNKAVCKATLSQVARARRSILIQTIPGANDILVDRDDITVWLAWFCKRHWSFSQIDYAAADHNGLHVFVKGRKRRAFVVDSMFNGMPNFRRRLEHDGIEIRAKTMTPESSMS